MPAGHEWWNEWKKLFYWHIKKLYFLWQCSQKKVIKMDFLFVCVLSRLLCRDCFFTFSCPKGSFFYNNENSIALYLFFGKNIPNVFCIFRLEFEILLLQKSCLTIFKPCRLLLCTDFKKIQFILILLGKM